MSDLSIEDRSKQQASVRNRFIAGGGYVLTLDCPERPGIVNAVSGFLLERHGDIRELKQFDDQRHSHCFLRVHLSVPSPAIDQPMGDGTVDPVDVVGDLTTAFGDVAERFDMRFELRPAAEPRRVLIMVSKLAHCLNDLLFRARVGELPIDVVAVVSNHPDHESLVQWHGIPFHHVPVTPETKPAAEAELMRLVGEHDVELVVLARYMQILSDHLVGQLNGRAINIHHCAPTPSRHRAAWESLGGSCRATTPNDPGGSRVHGLTRRTKRRSGARAAPTSLIPSRRGAGSSSGTGCPSERGP
jgi:formyltetrahydrofolate hydrolase